jgi:glucokinase
MSAYTIGVDLGGTNLRAAAIDRSGALLDKIAGATNYSEGRDAVLADLVRAVETIRERHGAADLAGIGVGVAGFIRMRDGFVTGSNNLPYLENFPVRDEIARRLETRVILENDANAAALGEAWVGAGRGVANLVLLTLGTGVGGGIIVDGHILHGHDGMAGEIGHTTIYPNGNPCGCGSRGCWEVYASNGAALRYYHQGKAERGDLSFSDLLSLAEQDDPRAMSALHQMAQYLGRGMRMIVAGLAPERIIVIGDVTRSWRRVGPVVEAEVHAQVLPGGCPPRIIPVHEDGMARLRGTVALVLEKHFGAVGQARA